MPFALSAWRRFSPPPSPLPPAGSGAIVRRPVERGASSPGAAPAIQSYRIGVMIRGGQSTISAAAGSRVGTGGALGRGQRDRCHRRAKRLRLRPASRQCRQRGLARPGLGRGLQRGVERKPRLSRRHRPDEAERTPLRSMRGYGGFTSALESAETDFAQAAHDCRLRARSDGLHHAGGVAAAGMDRGIRAGQEEEKPAAKKAPAAQGRGQGAAGARPVHGSRTRTPPSSPASPTRARGAIRRRISSACLPQTSGPWLAVSGGGSDGAFGGGVLAGWTESGSRPEFAAVTGSSIGALIAPYAFLGPGYDEAVRKNFTTISAADVFEDRMSRDSLFDYWPLKRNIEQNVTPTLLADIAAQHARGRRLLGRDHQSRCRTARDLEHGGDRRARRRQGDQAVSRHSARVLRASPDCSRRSASTSRPTASSSRKCTATAP